MDRPTDPVSVYLREKQTEVERLKKEFSSLKTLLNQLIPRSKTTSQSPTDDPKPIDSVSKPGLDLSTEAGKTARLLEFISKDTFSQLKELFITYATLQSFQTAERLELAQYHKLLQECNMLTTSITRAQADLWFFQRNSGKNITFWRFVEILAEFAKLFYSGNSGISRLQDYLLEVVFRSPGKRLVQVNISELERQLDQPETTLLLSPHLSLMKKLFKLYRSKDSKSEGKLHISGFTSLLTDFHMVPELLTAQEAARLFRAAGNKEFSATFLSYEEYKRCMGLVGLFSFSRAEAGEKRCHSSQESLLALFTWLSLSSEQLRVFLIDGRPRESNKFIGF